MPDLSLISKIDPSGENLAVYNRTGELWALLDDTVTEPQFELLGNYRVRVTLNPNDNTLRDLGIDYVVLTGRKKPSFHLLVPMEQERAAFVHFYAVVPPESDPETMP